MLTPIRRVKRRDPMCTEPSTPSKRVKREPLGVLTPPSSSHSAAQTGYSRARALFERGSRTRSFIGREAELATIAAFISRSIEKSAGALYISGVPGTGKSAMVTQTLETLGTATKVKVAKINCITVDNPDFIYSAILAAYGLPSFASRKEKALESLGEQLRDASLKHLLMLDEIDHFMRGNQEVLFQLFEWSCHPDSNLVLVGIANTLDLTDKFLPRLQAHDLVPEVLAVKPYEKQDIIRILEGQLENPTQFFTKGALELFSAKVATQTGDLRRAFDLCSRSLQHAEQDWLRGEAAGEPTGETAGEADAERPLIPVSLEHALMVCKESFGCESVVTRVQSLNYIQQCVLVTVLLMEQSTRHDAVQKSLSSADVAQRYAAYAAIEPSWTLLDGQEVLQVLTALESMSLVKISGVCGKRGLGNAVRSGQRASRGGGGAMQFSRENTSPNSRRVQSKIQMMDAFSAFTHSVLKRMLCE